MKYSEDEVRDILEEIIRETKLNREISRVVWRNDYEDYQVLVDGMSHSEIREKLIDDYVTFKKNKDVRKNIRFLLEHAVKYEEWELEDLDLDRQAKRAGDDKIELADDV